MFSSRCEMYSDLFDLMAFIQEYGFVPINLCRIPNNFNKVYPPFFKPNLKVLRAK